MEITRNSEPTDVRTLADFQEAVLAETEDVAFWVIETPHALLHLHIGDPKRGAITVKAITATGIERALHTDRAAAIADLIARVVS